MLQYSCDLRDVLVGVAARVRSISLHCSRGKKSRILPFQLQGGVAIPVIRCGLWEREREGRGGFFRSGSGSLRFRFFARSSERNHRSLPSSPGKHGYVCHRPSPSFPSFISVAQAGLFPSRAAGGPFLLWRRRRGAKLKAPA